MICGELGYTMFEFGGRAHFDDLVAREGEKWDVGGVAGHEVAV